MPRGKKNGKKKQGGGDGGRMVRIAGPGGFRMDFPIPRLPSWLGAGDRLAADAATYPRIDLDVPTNIQNVAMVAGAMASVIALDPNSLVTSWSARFANLFREYCVVGARFELTLTNGANPQGLVVVFMDETLATAPNIGSLYTPHLEVPIVSNPDSRTQILEYRPKGYEDLAWIPTVSTAPKQWLKFFASNAATLTGATTTGNIIVRGTLALAFRGFSNF